MPLPLLTFLRQGLLLLALLFLLPLARAEGVLLLDEPAPDAWPYVTVLEERAGPISPDQALAQRADFRVPATPRFNLGPRSTPVWLKLPLQARDDGRWVLQIDFALLDRVDAWLMAGGRVVAHAEMGDHVPAARQPAESLSPSWAMTLAPGVPHELLLRVDTRGPALVPLRLTKPRDFQRSESGHLLLQGLLAGVGVGLLVYALSQWADTRDSMFAWYGFMTSCGTFYFVALHGVGARFLWGYDNGWTDLVAPLTGLLGVGAALMLSDRLLDLRGLDRRVSRLAQGIAALAFVLAGLLALRVIPSPGSRR